MTHVLSMATFQVSHPVILFVLVKTSDFLIYVLSQLSTNSFEDGSMSLDRTTQWSILIQRQMGARRCSDPHRPNPPSEDRAVCPIIVAHQIARRRLPRKGLDNLLRQPLRRRMPGHRKPQQLTAARGAPKEALAGQDRGVCHERQ